MEELTSHTDSRGPAPCRCPSAGSCPRVQTSPAASLWPGSRFSRSRRAKPAHSPTPCYPQGEWRSYVLSERLTVLSEREKKELVFTLLQHKCHNSHAHWLILQVACLICLCFFPLSLPSVHFLLVQIQKNRWNRTLVAFALFGHLITCIRWGWKFCFSGTNCCKLCFSDQQNAARAQWATGAVLLQ